MIFLILFTMHEHQDLVLKEAQREVLSVFHSAFALAKLFEINAEGLNCEDAESKDEKRFAFVSSLFKMIFQFYLGFN